MKKRIYHLIIGGNLGDRIARLSYAHQLLAQEAGDILTHSRFYETEPWGHADQPWFLNQVVVLESDLSPIALLEVIKKIETEVGRKPAEKWHARTIDIDILLCGEEVIKQIRLDVPHPLMHKRNFVLIPLMEVAADHVHPILDKTIEEIFSDCKDKGEVYIYNLDEQENAI